MPSLRDLQLRFVAALYDADAPVPSEIATDAIAPAHRFAIYRNNLRVGFREALALDYPLLAKLVGADYFTALAREFQDVRPSRSGDLQHVSAPFASFVAQRHAGSPHDYFGDVAALEWALQAVQLAADAPALDVAALVDVAPEFYGELQLALRPACQLLRSRYPVLAIWRTQADETVDLDAGGDRVLVRNTAQGATCEALDGAEYELLIQIAGGATLGTALDAALAIDARFDLATCLRSAVARGVFGALPQAASDSGCGRPIA